MPRIVLASQSTSRRRLVEDAGLTVTVIVSEVDEETDFFNAMAPEDMVIALAIAKAHTVHKLIDYPAIIIGCDSTFDVDGISFGKPSSIAVAVERAEKISGRTGILHTGHCIIDTEKGVEIADRVSTKVTFSEMSRDEIVDYVASGEPLNVAGGFTLDGFGSAFIPNIEGDYTNVVGISMPFLRSAMKQLGYTWPQVKAFS